MSEQLQRKIRRLPPKSRVLIVLQDDLFEQTGRALVAHYRALFGKTWQFEAKATGSIRDLTTLVKSPRYQLVLLSPAVWNQAPKSLTLRGSRVAHLVDEPESQSLEATRIAAGVLV